MEEREEERKRKVAEKRAADARRRLEEVKAQDYQPHQWECKEEMEQVHIAILAVVNTLCLLSLFSNCRSCRQG